MDIYGPIHITPFLGNGGHVLLCVGLYVHIYLNIKEAFNQMCFLKQV